MWSLTILDRNQTFSTFPTTVIAFVTSVVWFLKRLKLKIWGILSPYIFSFKQYFWTIVRISSHFLYIYSNRLHNIKCHTYILHQNQNVEAFMQANMTEQSKSSFIANCSGYNSPIHSFILSQVKQVRSDSHLQCWPGNRHQRKTKQKVPHQNKVFPNVFVILGSYQYNLCVQKFIS